MGEAQKEVSSICNALSCYQVLKFLHHSMVLLLHACALRLGTQPLLS